MRWFTEVRKRRVIKLLSPGTTKQACRDHQPTQQFLFQWLCMEGNVSMQACIWETEAGPTETGPPCIPEVGTCFPF